MIDDLDDALRDLLIREMPIKNHEIDISFGQPNKEWSSRLSRPTLNLYLHDIRENPTLRRDQNFSELERRPDSVVQRRPPHRIALHYLVTAWATAPEDEHRMLARALLALLRYPGIARRRVAGRAAGSAVAHPAQGGAGRRAGKTQRLLERAGQPAAARHHLQRHAGLQPLRADRQTGHAHGRVQIWAVGGHAGHRPRLTCRSAAK